MLRLENPTYQNLTYYRIIIIECPIYSVMAIHIEMLLEETTPDYRDGKKG